MTQWQDTVIAICQTGFILAFIPTIRGEDKPATSTSVINSALVCIVAFAFFTLRLWYAFATAAVIALVWAVLAVQKIRLDKQKVLK